MTFPYPGKPPERHLPDRLALRLLVQEFQPELMDALVDKAERRERRRRLLPAQLMMYFALAMWLFGSSSYEEVLARLTGGLPEMFQDVGNPASAAAIARARMRLGVEPLRALCGHVAASAHGTSAHGTSAQGVGTAGPGPAGRRVLAFESLAMEAPDTPANRAAFGASPKKGHNLTVWLAALTDCRPRTVAAAAIAPSREQAVEGLLAEWPHDLLGTGALVVGDEETLSQPLWNALAESGADRLWRVGGPSAGQANGTANGRAGGPLGGRPGGAARDPLPVLRALPDGSYLSTLTAPAAGGPPRGPRQETVVRVVPYGAATPGQRRPAVTGPQGPRLVTSFLDDAVTADEIVARYAAAALDRTGVRQFAGQIAGPRVVLRSKSPELVKQEIYAMLCTYYVVGHLISPMYSDVQPLLSPDDRRRGWGPDGRPRLSQ